MRIVYDTNNSGGVWWLSDDDWRNLEAAGWDVRWGKRVGTPFKSADDMTDDDRWLGSLAQMAEVERETMEEAVREFERITGQDAEAFGCPCCGPPHNFYVERGE